MSVRFLSSFVGVVLVFFSLTACEGGREQDKGEGGKASAEVEEEVLSAEEKLEVKEHGERLEVFTGAHTRVVWSSQEKEDKADPFLVGGSNVLRGLDSRDGRGVRDLVSKRGNYARPLLNHDGTVILFTDKGISKPDNKKKHYKPVIYRLGWDGGEPVEVAEGYAMDMWVDPSTGVEWVYAARKLVPSTLIAIEARHLVRFPLSEPDQVELVYDETPIGTDNFQLSRDGTRASGLFPWPHCGIFRVEEDGEWKAEKLLTGCWPSMAPDNSGVSWVFDGPHRNGYFFADDGRPFWVVPFNADERMKNAEVYHPRWSNHARFMVITGPYIKDKNVKGSVIGKGGSLADVYLAKLDEKATKLEGWFRINEDKHGDAYPDVWIAGGEQANLVGYGTSKRVAAQEVAVWPVVKEGQLLIWKDRTALNSFKTREGQKMETRMEGHQAARFGRFNELVLDGGWYEVEEESAEPLSKQLADGKEVTLEALVYPGSDSGKGTFFSGVGMKLEWHEGGLRVSDGAVRLRSSGKVMQEQAFHLLVSRQGGKWLVYVNGKVVEMVEATGEVAEGEKGQGQLRFGGGWDAGVQWLGAYDVAFSAEQVEQSANSALSYVGQLPPAPERVRLRGKLVEESAMPTAEGIDPYSNALVAYVYEVEEVLEGEFAEKQVLVKHWAMLGREPVLGFPYEIEKSYELVIERQSDHPYLQGERVMDDTIDGLGLEPWLDVKAPRTVE